MEEIASYSSPRQFVFWRNLFLIYVVFAMLGHLLELMFSHTGPRLFSRAPFSPPYGIGVVALTLVVPPLIKRCRGFFATRLKPPLARLAAILIILVTIAVLLTLVELACGYFCIWIWGHNPFWHYSGPFALFGGTVHLATVAVFGLGGVVAIFWLVPPLQQWLRQANQRFLNIVFWLLALAYAADLFLAALEI